MKILAPIQAHDGCSYFRITVPSAYFSTDNLTVDRPEYLLNKYKNLRTGMRIADKIAGTIADRIRLLERSKMVTRSLTYDSLWLLRSLLSFPNKLDEKLQNFVYDFDDAVWLNFHRKCLEALILQ